MNKYKNTLLTSILTLPFFLFFIWSVFRNPISLMIAFSATFLFSMLFLDPSINLKKEAPLFSFLGLLTLFLRPYYILRDIFRSSFVGACIRIVYMMILAIVLIAVVHGLPSDMQIYYYWFTYKRELYACIAGAVSVELVYPLAVALFPPA